jgi:hypothetical protein
MDGFRESLFAVFYVMTEQNSQYSKQKRFEFIRRFILYLIDAGQIMRAIVIPEFGWDSSIRTVVGKFDLFNFILETVSARPVWC